METIAILKKRIIDKVQSSYNQENLQLLDEILSKIDSNETYNYTEIEKKLIAIAEEDIIYGRTLSQEELDKQDEEWM